MNTRVIGIVLILLALWLGLRGGSVFAPPPFATDKLSVLIVEKPGERSSLSSGQLDILLGTGDGTIRGYVESKGGQWALVDPEPTPDLSNAFPWVAAAFAVERQSVPWIVAASPTGGFSHALGTDEAAQLAELRSLGGN